MMGRGGTNSTIGAMHFGTCALAFAAGRAIQDGVQRAREIKAVDDAHAVGQRYYAARVGQRKAAVRAQATASKSQLLAMRADLHGE